ncbi:MAG: VOC family protein [Promethearchaeota archaeon]|jgi:catechol 2,3-dioxygenase-like lactoylglutathione lyase family enzyme
MLKKDWELHHVCLVVRDWNDAVHYYQNTRMGVNVGPQVMGLDYQVNPPYWGKDEIPKFYVNKNVPRTNGGLGPGKPMKVKPEPKRKELYKFIDKDVQVGDLLLEIGQNRDIPFEGITHICFNVPDINAETNNLLEKDCEEMSSFIQGDLIMENHLDTRKYGNVDISFRPPLRKHEKAWMDHNRSHPNLKDWKFQGIGIGVRDLDKSVEYWQMLDIIDFQSEIELDSNSFATINVSSESIESNFKARVRIGHVGPVAFEFIQPLEGTSIYHESLDSRGEGVAEMTFTVTDLEKEAATMIYRGMPVVLSGKPKNDPAFACFDARENNGNILIKLIQRD